MYRAAAVFRCLAIMILLMLACHGNASAATTGPVSITLNHSVIALNGPWKFHAGDNPNWANPDFDDTSWETVDLTPLPGAHDSDVGLTGYVPGWQARGHPGYIGYAWYRLTVDVNAPAGDALALSGPPDVDSAYQLFLNGRLLDGIGDFSGRTPKVYSIQPRLISLPQTLIGGHPSVIAIRVWMGSWDTAPDGGGLHIAPAIGERSDVEARYQLQWLETIKGYVVEVVEALLFVLLAIMSCSLIPFDRWNRSYLWMAAALLLVGMYRANQAALYWGQFETVPVFELVSYVLLTPLCLGAWTLAWRSWFQLDHPAWVPKFALILTLLYMVAQLFSSAWSHDTWPPSIALMLGGLISVVRLLFLLLLGAIVTLGIRKQGRNGWYALPAVLFIAIGLFAQELSALHVPGIWFPFGTGVSRAQFAYLAFDVAFFALLLRRLWAFARSGWVRH
ncbi:hypothetical protein GCM10007862_09280 [Dyella lipolytica]|uniref:hypothetical protein n=1 Tax=Dyella lipolytica TaxID=1867835 RepID=UPI00235CD2FA|nr:hypothetical protein [Dyella lipolytica]GLQ45877.1 hypothetical protein GCM10007862_09280 [Dyella lipolytica]